MATTSAESQAIDRGRLQSLLERERARYASEHPRSRELSRQAQATLLAGVPMSMMGMLPGAFPLFFEGARGDRLTDVDGHSLIDFCLGDGGALTGHSPAAVVEAVHRHLDKQGGLTTMLPTADAVIVGAELGRRFGLPLWQFALTATDANRWVLRLCRMVQKRRYVLVFNHCYHGSVDETIVMIGPDGTPMAKPGNVGPQVDPTQTTKVVEFNDLGALSAALAPRDVAAVLMEPVMTNIGIVPPEPGFLEAVRALCDESGTLLIDDETHALSAGIGGCTRAYGLRPDLVTVGKAIASGIPMAAYGVSAEMGERIVADPQADLVDTGGVGGTLAGNALSTAAARATLERVLTEPNYEHMIALATRYSAGVQAVIEEYALPWVVLQLGARAEYRFCANVPRSGGESWAARDAELDELMHLSLLNRGIFTTPFHNAALMCPETTAADVDRHTEVFAEVVGELRG